MLQCGGVREPGRVGYGHIGGEAETLKQAPAFFDATSIQVRQFFATSKDGTAVPYFVVGPREPGSGPVLLTGYGGFRGSPTPPYTGVLGRGWLAPGGAPVGAHPPRGGQERPPW